MANSPGAISTWPDKVRAVTRWLSLIPPDVDPTVLTTVYDALFDDRRFTARCRRHYDGELKDYVVNPLRLVFRDSVVYLVCYLIDYTDVPLLVLHRMEHAEATAVRHSIRTSINLFTACSHSGKARPVNPDYYECPLALPLP